MTDTDDLTNRSVHYVAEKDELTTYQVSHYGGTEDESTNRSTQS
jgi:hypothetical protein